MSDAVYDLSPEFQARVALACASRPDFYARAGYAIDSALVADPACALLIRTAQAVAADMGHGPREVATVLQRLVRLHGDGKVTAAELDAVACLTEHAVGPDDELVLELAPLLRAKLDRSAARAAIDLMSGKGDRAHARALLEKADALGRGRGDVGFVLGRESFEEVERIRQLDTCSTGILELDVLFSGGVPRGELLLWVGASGSGKSMCLGQQAAVALLDGRTVAYATFELAPALVLARIKSCLTGVPIDSILRTAEGLAECKRRIDVLMPHLGMLVVEEFARKRVTIADTFAWVDRIGREKGRKVEVFQLDYIDEVYCGDPRMNEYQGQGVCSAALRDGIRSRGIWGNTATQARRSAGKGLGGAAKRVEGDDIGESLKKLQLTDKAVTLHVADDMLTCFVAKNRTGIKDQSVGPLPCDFACGRIAPLPAPPGS